MSAPTTPTTHERFVHAVRDAIVARALTASTITPEDAERIAHTKLLYGVGDGSYRGICYYDKWENGIGKVAVVEIAASAQESWVQLAGTTLHELAHVLAGFESGHGTDWKDAAVKLGFTIRPAAAGQVYHLAMIAPALRTRVYALAASIGDGSPAFRLGGNHGYGPGFAVKPRPCSMGIGTRGGTSRGKGSGSRMRLWVCECPKPVKVRVASDDFRAHCDHCDAAFKRSDTT